MLGTAQTSKLCTLDDNDTVCGARSSHSLLRPVEQTMICKQHVIVLSNSTHVYSTLITRPMTCAVQAPLPKLGQFRIGFCVYLPRSDTESAVSLSPWSGFDLDVKYLLSAARPAVSPCSRSRTAVAPDRMGGSWAGSPTATSLVQSTFPEKFSELFVEPWTLKGFTLGMEVTRPKGGRESICEDILVKRICTRFTQCDLYECGLLWTKRFEAQCTVETSCRVNPPTSAAIGKKFEEFCTGFTYFVQPKRQSGPKLRGSEIWEHSSRKQICKSKALCI